MILMFVEHPRHETKSEISIMSGLLISKVGRGRKTTESGLFRYPRVICKTESFLQN